MARALMAFSAALLLASSAHATNVTVMKGEALISHGNGYEGVQGVAAVSPGDTIVAKAGTSVRVTFSNGCSVYLGTGMVFNVPAKAPCEGDGNGNAETTTAALGDANASPSQDWSGVTQTTFASEQPQTTIMPYLLGAAAIGGIAAGAIAFSGSGGGGGSPPASP